MCYAYKPVRTPSGTILMHTVPEIRRLEREGKIREVEGEFYFAKDTVPVIIAGGAVVPMRWDLIPSGFLRGESATATEAVRKKNSRALNPATGKSWGFSSYNARMETVRSLWAFKDAWSAGRRGIMPVEAFKERPNMEGAPAEFTGREYEISLDRPYFLAALYDTWTSRDGERLDSCTVVTGPSDNVPAVRAIWHERVPILLSEESCAAWLDPKTTPEAAWALLRSALSPFAPQLTVAEIPRSTLPGKTKSPASSEPSLFDGLAGSGEPSL
jgi:putative SOS response-associated peptidase YedK